MGSLNRVTLIGNLGANPETKFLPSGQSVTEMRLAMNEKWTDKNGVAQERTEWITVTVWGKSGENCSRFLTKGRQVCVEGRLQTRDWVDKTHGDKRYKTEVVASQVTFLGAKGETNNDFVEDTGPRETNGAPVSTPASEDDIPF